MKMLNENELTLVNGGVPICNCTYYETAGEKEERLLEAWHKWVRQEKQKMEGIADIRMRAAEDALKAAMRVARAEMDIKAAQRAAMGLD